MNANIKKPPVVDSAVGVGELAARLGACSVVQLGHELFIGAPRIESHPPFMYSLTSQHGSGSMPGQFPGVTGASDCIAMGLHTGTHIDSLSHIAFNECLSDGTNVMATGVQNVVHGIRMTSGEAMRPIVAKGVLLDFPDLIGKPTVSRDFGITPDDVERCAVAQGVSIEKGDVVLFRTGWDTLWSTPTEFTRFPMPGPTAATARMLVQREVVATGADTLTYEQAPGEHPLEVHAELISKAGIFIMEAMDLQELARRRAYRFLFVVIPLRVEGATGSPVNPIALVSP